MRIPEDVQPASGVAFSTTCTWAKDTLTFAFAAGTSDIAGDAERDAVRRAFASWSATVQLAFREVGTGDSPDIRIAWTPAKCGDADMTGSVLAHSDYPPGCGFYGNALPRPLHFDDQENTWCIGAVAGQYDVETMPSTKSATSSDWLTRASPARSCFRLSPRISPVECWPRMTSRGSGACIRSWVPSSHGIAAGAWISRGSRLDNGADATQWDYWGGQNQIFRIEWVEAAHYRLIAQHSGRVLDVDGISTANGAQIQQWDWWGGDNQKYRLDPLGQGYYRVVPKHSGKCMDVSGGSVNLGAKVIQWDWWGGNNQQWRLGPAPISARHSGKTLDIEGGGTGNGARLIQWDYWGGANQRFRLDPVGDGYYRIMIESSGKCLDVFGISTDSGAVIQQWEWWGGDNQRFKPEPTGDGFYRLVAKHSGKVIDVSGGSTGSGAVLIQWDWWGGNNQQFRL